MTLPPTYFADMYAGAEDPWGFRSRWYEQRKRDVTLAALTRPRYRRAFEPGCSIGVLTAALADRCDEVVAADVDERAVATARGELARHRHVRVERLSVPQEWPDGMFDLVVISEVAYYLGAGRARAAARPRGRLAGAGAGHCSPATGGTRCPTTRPPATTCTPAARAAGAEPGGAVTWRRTSGWTC